MNSVLSYKKLALGLDVASLLNDDVMNFEEFRASVLASVKKFRNKYNYTEGGVYAIFHSETWTRVIRS